MLQASSPPCHHARMPVTTSPVAHLFSLRSKLSCFPAQVRRSSLPAEFWDARRRARNHARLQRNYGRRKRRGEALRQEEEERLAGLGEEQRAAYAAQREAEREAAKQAAAQQRQRVAEAMEHGLCIVVDCSLSAPPPHGSNSSQAAAGGASDREVRSLCKQLELCAAANKRAAAPVSLRFASFAGRVRAFAEEGMHADRWPAARGHEEALDQLFPSEELVVLSPDAEEALGALEQGKASGQLGGVAGPSAKHKAVYAVFFFILCLQSTGLCSCLCQEFADIGHSCCLAPTPLALLCSSVGRCNEPVGSVVLEAPASAVPLIALLLSRLVRQVYVIGGLVDRTVQKGASLRLARQHNARAVRLPIAEHLGPLAKGKGVLNVNDVFAALLAVHAGQGWRAALEAAIPQRFRQAQTAPVVPTSAAAAAGNADAPVSPAMRTEVPGSNATAAAAAAEGLAGAAAAVAAAAATETGKGSWQAAAEQQPPAPDKPAEAASAPAVLAGGAAG